ncbi:hypothetical protein HO133_004028 [Letharia lupina]|uniref:Uncharacterized protein n=1 Tax=Letharia lupina TaxID=560253 RepID=A0A8H6F9G8_9LECA|nr:uncharacterized protein HO133_004028 [Letharia lupina]KAF6219559.1 hypothetical protein HO133_004028 [Letharia lupina]
MMPGTGRPTQFHGVPFEERAPDGKGGKLPFALEYPAGHPDAPRGQKRLVEEKGSFGKSTRRKTPSRTRSATPAKKEINPTLDGFLSALNYDTQRAIESPRQANVSTRSQNDGNVASHHRPSHNKEPTQIIVSGFAPSTQWAAIDTYEKISHGLICEDYARRPPAELRRYPNTLSSPSVHPRKLTDPEREMARHYAGGESWVRLTCDSAEAADRAVEMSPQQVHGHWVYAELYNGTRPETDLPIPVREERQRRGSFGSPKPQRRPPQTLSAAFSQHAINQQRPTSTLPRSFGMPATTQANNQRPNDAASFSSSTASSATATGPDDPDLRNRHPSQAEDNRSSSTTQKLTDTSVPESNLTMMRYFTDRPRTVLRPATEAFLPQPTWTDRQVQWLRSWGVIPGDFIGNGPHLTENGDFDWSRASWYWCFWNWMDTYLNTNFCNLKDE